MKNSKRPFKFDWLSSIITFFVTFIFTKIFEPVLEILYSSLIKFGGSLISSLADSTYQEISKGFCEQNAEFTAYYIYVAVFLFGVILIFNSKQLYSDYIKAFDAIDKSVSDLHGENTFKEENAPVKTAEEISQQSQQLRKQAKFTYYALLCTLVFFLVVHLYSYGKVSFINNTVIKTTNNIEILSPYISDQEYKMLKSEFHSMQGKSDYEIFVKKLDSLAEQHSVPLK